MDEHEILDRVRSLVDQEHALRQRTGAGDLDPGEERAQLAQLEVALDQCWDLLRQRRARIEAGQDPGTAATRPAPEVEGYRQ